VSLQFGEVLAFRFAGSSRLDLPQVGDYVDAMKKSADVKDLADHILELIRQVEEGHEVVVTRGNKPVAKLVPASPLPPPSSTPFKVRSLKGHRVLTPTITQSDLADSMFRPA
jgi:prevent-host-death family protein